MVTRWPHLQRQPSIASFVLIMFSIFHYVLCYFSAVVFSTTTFLYLFRHHFFPTRKIAEHSFSLPLFAIFLPAFPVLSTFFAFIFFYSLPLAYSGLPSRFIREFFLCGKRTFPTPTLWKFNFVCRVFVLVLRTLVCAVSIFYSVIKIFIKTHSLDVFF